MTRTPPKKERVEAKAAPHVTTDKLLRALAANLARAGDHEPELIARLKAAIERVQAARRTAP
jgi:hypothetical protein